MTTIKFTPLGADGKPIESKKDYKKKSLFTPLRADGKPIDSKEPIKEKPKPKPTLGQKALSFGKELAKDATKTLLVRPAVRATEAITRTLAPESMATKGYEEMADKKESQKLLGMDIEAQKGFGEGGAKQIAGNALETAGWLYGTGKVANLAIEQAASQGIKKFGTRLAREGAISTMLGSSGSQLSENGKIDIKQLVKDVAVGTVLTPIAGIGLSKILGKGTSNVATKIDEIPKKKIVYSGEPVGEEITGKTKFYTPNKETASKYAEINKNVTGKSQVVERDISELKLKKVTQEEMQDALENPQIKKEYDGIEFQVAGEKEPSYAIFDKIKEKPTKPTKISDADYKQYKKAADDAYDSFKQGAENADDPIYKQQVGNIRPESAIKYLSENTIDDAFDIARGVRGISPDAGFTAPYMKEFLIKSGKLTDDQTYRLLNSKAVESLSGSSLQSVSPLQSFISKANKAIKESSKRYSVANKKTIRNLFEGLEC